MKYFIAVAFTVFIVFQGFAQTTKKSTSRGFRIIGNVPSFKDSVVLGWVSGCYFDLQWTRAVNGKFVFTGDMPRPTCAVISSKDGSFSRLMCFQNGDISITQKVPGGKAVVKGSPINDDYEEFVAFLEPTSNKIKMLYHEIDELKVKDSVAATRKKVEELAPAEQQHFASMRNYIATHPKKLFSLMQLIITPMKLTELKSLFYSLDPVVRNTPEGAYVLKQIASQTTEYVGKPIIDFVQKSNHGTDVDSKSFRGKYLLIDFWASWCGPCRMEHPIVLKAYERFKEKGFDIIGISLDRNEKEWYDAIREDNIPWLQVSDLKGMNNEVSNLYSIVSVPSNFLVDPSGMIIAKNLRGDALEMKLQELFSSNK